MGIASRELKHNGYKQEASEMINRITKDAKSYEDALAIMCEYIEPVDQYGMEDNFDDYDSFDIGI